MTLKRTTTTTYTDVVSLASAKLHLRVDHTDDDELIQTLIRAAGEVVEEYTGTYLASCNWTYYADRFYGIMRVHIGPEATVTSVKYTDSTGTLQTVSGADYHTDLASYPIRIQLEEEPTDVDDRVNVVEINGSAGYTTAPNALVQAMLLIVGHLYEHRKDVTMGVNAQQLPSGARYLMDKHRKATI